MVGLGSLLLAGPGLAWVQPPGLVHRACRPLGLPEESRPLPVVSEPLPALPASRDACRRGAPLSGLRLPLGDKAPAWRLPPLRQSLQRLFSKLVRAVPMLLFGEAAVAQELSVAAPSPSR
jgi:hypothetical protein